MVVKLFDAEVVNSFYDLEKSIKRVIASHHYVLGNEVSSFEKNFAEYNNSKYCVSLANGTDALELAMRAVSVGHGDKVAMVANAGFYGSTAAYRIGAIPVYVDIDDDLTMSFESFKEAVKLDIKAVIITHLYGKISSQLEQIIEVAQENGIRVIEDCAQAHGAILNNKKAGTFGDIGCFSFYPTKNLGAIGDGGAIISDKEDIYKRVKTLRQYGWSKKYYVDFPYSCNSRLDELQAAVLDDKLPFLDEMNEKRRSVARRYNDAFKNISLITPSFTDKEYVAHLYVIRSEKRDELKLFLESKGIMTDIHYPVPDHLQKAYQRIIQCDNLQKTIDASKTVLTFPCYPGMSNEQIDFVIDAVHPFFKA